MTPKQFISKFLVDDIALTEAAVDFCPFCNSPAVFMTPDGGAAYCTDCGQRFNISKPVLGKTEATNEAGTGTLRGGGMNKMVTCRGCGKRTHSSINGNLGINLCRDCYDDAGQENEHNDTHDPDDPQANCKYCQTNEDFDKYGMQTCECSLPNCWHSGACKNWVETDTGLCGQCFDWVRINSPSGVANLKRNVESAVQQVNKALSEYAFNDTDGDEPGEKDIARMQDLKTKAGDDTDKILQLAGNMARAITYGSEKATRRAAAAKQVFPGAFGKKLAKLFMTGGVGEAYPSTYPRSKDKAGWWCPQCGEPSVYLDKDNSPDDWHSCHNRNCNWVEGPLHDTNLRKLDGVGEARVDELGVETVLFGTKDGVEQLLLSHPAATPANIAKVKVLAAKDGFSQFRVMTVDLSVAPDFTGGLRRNESGVLPDPKTGKPISMVDLIDTNAHTDMCDDPACTGCGPTREMPTNFDEAFVDSTAEDASDYDPEDPFHNAKKKEESMKEDEDGTDFKAYAGAKANEHPCSQCGKPNYGWILGDPCMSCVRKNHRKAVGRGESKRRKNEADWDVAGDSDHDNFCATCNGLLAYIGTLGNLRYFRCQNCGSTVMIAANPHLAAESKAVREVEAKMPTSGPCHCKPGVERDNCSDCEGTGQQIDWRAFHAAKGPMGSYYSGPKTPAGESVKDFVTKVLAEDDDRNAAPDAEELQQWIENDSDLYRQQTVPIIDNVKRRIKNGTYDAALAPKLWRYLADAGAKSYAKALDAPVASAAVRQQCADAMASEYYEKIKNGEYD